jgi:uncharacterized protein (TIGR02145 family)
MNIFTRQGRGRTLLLTVTAVVGMVWFSVCGGESNPGSSGDGGGTAGGGVMTPIGNNNCGMDGSATSCRTVVIGNQTWMAENLNFPTSEGSWCYENSVDNCSKYGRLYNWATAMTVCPTGWRLPDTADWHRVVEAAGGASVAGRALKSVNGWENYAARANTNATGFSALPGGSWMAGDKNFSGRYLGGWWLATEYMNNAFAVGMASVFDYALCVDNVKRDGFSVRCVAE